MTTEAKISRKQHILHALMEMLEDPNMRITTAALAKRVGVSEAALYRHFASKAQMFDALIEFVEEKGEQFIPQAVAPLYDYYYVENQKGFKKKVAPALVGKLQTSDTEIPFSINQNNHSFVLHYQSQWDVWESNIVQLDSQRLILKEGARKYFYQRVRPNPISNE